MDKLTLKEWRRVKGVSQESLAEALKISPLTLRRWESGSAKIPVQAAIMACDFLGVPFVEVNFFAK